MKKPAIIMIIILTLFLTACGQEQGEEQSSAGPEEIQEPVFRVQMTTPVSTVDPAYVQNESEISVSRLVFQGLVQETPAGEIIPCAARTWQVTPDKKTYTFYLREGVIFHNGREVTASDFKFSWERVLRLNAPSAYLFSAVLGADEVLSGQQKQALGITAVDNYTLRVTLARPQDDFVSSLVHPAAAVLDRYEVVEQGVNFAKPGSLTQPGNVTSGIGPYKLIEWVGGRSLTLGRFTGYFAPKPPVSRVEMNFNRRLSEAVFDFIAGKTVIIQDMTKNEMPSLPEQTGEISLYETPVRQFRYIGMNANIPPFNIKEVRDAVCYAVDAEDILKAVRGTSGEIIPGFITDYWYGQNTKEKAKYLNAPLLALASLSQANYPFGEGLPELALYCGSAAEDVLAAKAIADNLAKFKMNVKVTPMPTKDLRKAVRNGEVAFYTMEFSAKSPELDDFFNEQVNSRWQKTINNPEWDQFLINAGTLNGNQRLDAYRSLERLVLNDTRIRYLYSYQTAAAVSDRLRDFQITKGNNIAFDLIAFPRQGEDE